MKGKIFCSVVGCVILTMILTPVRSFGDSYQPSHSCHKPFKPSSFSSQSELEDFRWEVDRYRRCIQDFVDEQQQEIENHRNAVNEAIEEWNSFVRRNF